MEIEIPLSAYRGIQIRDHPLAISFRLFGLGARISSPGTQSTDFSTLSRYFSGADRCQSISPGLNGKDRGLLQIGNVSPQYAIYQDRDSDRPAAFLSNRRMRQTPPAAALGRLVARPPSAAPEIAPAIHRDRLRSSPDLTTAGRDDVFWAFGVFIDRFPAAARPLGGVFFRPADYAGRRLTGREWRCAVRAPHRVVAIGCPRQDSTSAISAFEFWSERAIWWFLLSRIWGVGALIPPNRPRAL